MNIPNWPRPPSRGRKRVENNWFTASSERLGRKADALGNSGQIGENELIARDSLANYEPNFKIEHWTGINEGVKLAFFAARIDAGRQGGEELLVELPSDEFCIELLGINAGQLRPQARSNHRACQSMSRLAPQREYRLQAGTSQLLLPIGPDVFEKEIAESNCLDFASDRFFADCGHQGFVLLIRTRPRQMHWPER